MAHLNHTFENNPWRCFYFNSAHVEFRWQPSGVHSFSSLWDPGAKFRLSGLCGKSFFLPDHVINPNTAQKWEEKNLTLWSRHVFLVTSISMIQTFVGNLSPNLHWNRSLSVLGFIASFWNESPLPEETFKQFSDIPYRIKTWSRKPATYPLVDY